ncbi:MAG: hypothetical protein ACXVIH_06520, partial [Ilumatobacteraceae bacterium]
MSGSHVPVRRVVDIAAAELRGQFVELLGTGHRLALVAAHHDSGDGDPQCIRVVYVMVSGPPDARVELRVRLAVDRPSVPSLAEVSFP